MSNKQFRVTITLDSKKDQDILAQLEQMAEKHQIGAFMSNVVRKAFDNSTPSSLSEMCIRDSYVCLTQTCC